MLFSLNKILVLLGVISAVFAAFRFVSQWQAMQKAKPKKQPKQQSQKQQEPEQVTLIACERCGAFAPPGQCDCNQKA